MHQVIIDNDTAQDDCVTILLGLLHPHCDVKAVTLVAGNIDFDRQVANAQLTLAVAGKLGEVPIHLGCRQPLLRPWVSAADVHGDGAGGLTIDVGEEGIAKEHAVDALLRLTAENPKQIDIVCIGPLTNIAAAVVKDRRFKDNVKSLYIMGGSNNGRGNITPAAEFNFYVDPEAAQIVLDAGFPDIHIVTWDPVTLRDATYPRSRYNELTSIDTTLARFFTKVCDATVDFNESVGVQGTTHPDSITLAALLQPELILGKARYRVDVETSSPLTRGYSAMAWDKYDVTPNAWVIERMDSEGFYRVLEELLHHQVTPHAAVTGL